MVLNFQKLLKYRKPTSSDCHGSCLSDCHGSRPDSYRGGNHGIEGKLSLTSHFKALPIFAISLTIYWEKLFKLTPQSETALYEREIDPPFSFLRFCLRTPA